MRAAADWAAAQPRAELEAAYCALLLADDPTPSSSQIIENISAAPVIEDEKLEDGEMLKLVTVLDDILGWICLSGHNAVIRLELMCWALGMDIGCHTAMEFGERHGVSKAQASKLAREIRDRWGLPLPFQRPQVVREKCRQSQKNIRKNGTRKYRANSLFF